MTPIPANFDWRGWHFELIKRESQLKAIVNRERAAEKVAAGLGDPRSVFVRF